jgi:hypothetical protein
MLVTIPAAIAATSSFGGTTAIVVTLGTLVACVPLFHFAFRSFVPRYEHLVTEKERLEKEIAALAQKVAQVRSKYVRRRHGQQFKEAFQLRGKTVLELEEALAAGMYFEEKEVFVTAFIQSGIAVRVTASIGSLRRCAPADSPLEWRHHADRLECDEIRQYHNHPDHTGKTEPSMPDYSARQSFRAMLHVHEDKLRTFIIFWNQIGEWRIIEYNDKGYCSHFEFDASL